MLLVWRIDAYENFELTFSEQKTMPCAFSVPISLLSDPTCFPFGVVPRILESACSKVGLTKSGAFNVLSGGLALWGCHKAERAGLA